MVGQNREDLRTQYFYRQQVIDRIQEKFLAEGVIGIFLPKLIEANEIELITTAIQLFGRWENAIVKAGLGFESLARSQELYNDFWTPEIIIAQFKVLFEAKVDLSVRFIRQIYPELYSAVLIQKNFDSWSAIFEEAGLEVQNTQVAKNRYWTPTRIIQTLQDYDMTYGNVQPEFIQVVNPSLYSSTRHYYRSWSEAITDAGVTPERSLMKFMLEPLRSFVLMELLKNVYEVLGIKVQVITYDSMPMDPNTNSKMKLDSSESVESSEDLESLESLKSIECGDWSSSFGAIIDANDRLFSETTGLKKYYLEHQMDKNKSVKIAFYRGWSFEADLEVYKMLERFPKIDCYYLHGEPRRWVDESVEFVNIDHFYPELERHGRDDLISAVNLLSRGGIPETYLPYYNMLMKEIQEKLKEISKQNSNATR